MTESFRYIEILCKVGCGVHTANTDFEYCIKAAKPHLDLLESLDYNAMFAESFSPNAKTILKAWNSSEVKCVSVKWLQDHAGEMLQSLEWMYKDIFRKEGEKQLQEGNWSFEQYQNWRLMCDSIVDIWYKRLGELMKAYGMKLTAKAKDMPTRTNGAQKGKKRHIRPESDFDRKKLETANSFEGAKYLVFPVEHFFEKVSHSLFESVNYDDLKKALQQANPYAIGNGNRVDILYFVFKMYSTNYVAPSRQEDYIKTVQEEIHKLKPDFNFSTLPHKDVQEEIWDFNKKDFKKNIKYHQKMPSPKGDPDF